MPIKQMIHYEITAQPPPPACPESYLILTMANHVDFMKAIFVGDCESNENQKCWSQNINLFFACCNYHFICKFVEFWLQIFIFILHENNCITSIRSKSGTIFYSIWINSFQNETEFVRLSTICIAVEYSVTGQAKAQKFQWSWHIVFLWVMLDFHEQNMNTSLFKLPAASAPNL